MDKISAIHTKSLLLFISEKGGEQQSTIGGLSANSTNHVHINSGRNNGTMLPNATSNLSTASQPPGTLSATATTGHTTVPVVSASNLPNNHHHNVTHHNPHHHNIGSAPNGGAAGPPRDCAGCGKRITERFLLKALDLFWHEDCLKCGCCDCRLGEVGSTLYTKANLILCKRDYLR